MSGISTLTKSETIIKDDDVEIIDQIEWAESEEDGKYGELASKPKADSPGEPCTCDGESAKCTDLSCLLFACQEECRSNCPAGKNCMNKRIQKRKWKELEIFDAGPKGKGLRLLEDVKKGDYLVEYVGRAVRKEYLQRLFRKYQQERRLYIMALDTHVYLDARKKGGIARYINHSCEPNCVVERWKVRGTLRAGIFATRDIKSGEELSFDYQWERKRGRAPTKCHCQSTKCRGTLEKEELPEDELWYHDPKNWKPPIAKAPKFELINRTIQLLPDGETSAANYSDPSRSGIKVEQTRHNDDESTSGELVDSDEEEEEYQIRKRPDPMSLAYITQYNEASGKHLLLSRESLQETWLNLSRRRYLLLENDIDEDDDFFIISKKQHSAWRGHSKNNTESPTSLVLMSQQEQQHWKSVKHYMYVQTPIKQTLWSKHLVSRCESNCRVTIQAQQMARPPLLPDKTNPEEVEKYNALDQSKDGTVWKLTISGADVPKAYTILEKNVAWLENKKRMEEMAAMPGATTQTSMLSSNGAIISNPTAINAHSFLINANTQEVVIPRLIVDHVKRRLPMLREKCRNINISFAHSESKSKQIAKLIIEGNLATTDLQTAKESLWTVLLETCAEANAPLARNGIYYDLGFAGGELDGRQFQLLLDKNDEIKHQAASYPSATTVAPGPPSSTAPRRHQQQKYQDCREQNLQHSSFFKSFENTNRCTVWVQSVEDKGRIDGSNNIVAELTVNSPRKIFFGCDPKEVSKLWNLIQTRASEVNRGVKYLYLGADRVYQPLMMQKGGLFFEYVRKVTGASVTVDLMTGDHLRIEGLPTAAIDLTSEKCEQNSESQSTALASELILLQIDLYRDHCIRQQNWIFGRDWSLMSSTASAAITSTSEGIKSQSLTAASPRLQFDEKNVGNACQEIVDIVGELGVGGGVAVHASLMLYRYVTILKESAESSFKIREVVLACIFIANKSQKMFKWKKLNIILEAAYSVFYPGAKFDRNKEEVLVLEEKVINAEEEVLRLLDYDVFWHGVDWIITAVIEAGHMKQSLASSAFDFLCSGPVLAAGATLWLKYGVGYVFAAAAGFLGVSKLKDIISTLSLIPVKVSQAAEIIATSKKINTPNSASASPGVKFALLYGGKEKLADQLPRIKEICLQCMSQGFHQQSVNIGGISESQQRFRIIGERDRRRRIIRNVDRTMVKDHILPLIDGASAESKCDIYIEESTQEGTEDILLEGSWRSLAIAEHLIRKSLSGASIAPIAEAVDVSNNETFSQVQAKNSPGLLKMSAFYTSDGWKETIQSEVSNLTTWGKKTGGKSCVAGRLTKSSLKEVGLQWWIPPQHGPSASGSICDMFLVRSNPTLPLDALSQLTKSVVVDYTSTFPMLTSKTENRAMKDGQDKDGVDEDHNLFVAVSLQRWPSDKVEKKEREKYEKGTNMQMGFSAAALQEMQLLTELHSLIPSPQGHSNFILPVCLAIRPSDDDEDGSNDNGKSEAANVGSVSNGGDDSDIFSLFRTSEENEKRALQEKKRKNRLTGPHLVFQPTPFVLQRFMSSRKKRNSGRSISAVILSSWFHDLLSALVHCHTNNVILRSLHPDQIVVDHSGMAKLGGLYRATVLSPEERDADFEIVKTGKISHKPVKVNDDIYTAPEHLLGYTKYSKASDVWAMGCLLAHLLLSKPLFPGKDGESLLKLQFKIVGTIAKDNFELGAKLPNYSKPVKKYVRGVDRAFNYMLKDEDEIRKHAGAIDLLDKMLHLDPQKRISAVDALRHHYMLDYVENSNSKPFCEQFVVDWISLKETVMKSTQSEEEEEKTRERRRKRKAFLMEASKNDDDDGLYDMDDFLGGGSLSKKQD